MRIEYGLDKLPNHWVVERVVPAHAVSCAPVHAFPCPHDSAHISAVVSKISVVGSHISDVVSHISVVTRHVLVIASPITVVARHVSIVASHVPVVASHVSVVTGHVSIVASIRTFGLI